MVDYLCFYKDIFKYMYAYKYQMIDKDKVTIYHAIFKYFISRKITLEL